MDLETLKDALGCACLFATGYGLILICHGMGWW